MSQFTTRLFLEGYEADLTDTIDITSTYSIDDVKDLTSIASDYSLTITLPGTANNTKLFNYLHDIQASNTANSSYTGKNIGYNYSFVKKAKAVVTQDGAIVFDGYAKIAYSSEKKGLVSFSIQLSSELTSFVSILGSYKLEDLYPNTLPTPYDHKLTLSGVTNSWTLPTNNPETGTPYPFGRGFFYPLIDYGYETTNATNFYTTNLRACLFAKTYWDEIFDFAGYTYSSNFLNSDYFSNLIIPYKDGEQLLLSTVSQFDAGISGSDVSQSLVHRSVTSGQQYIYNVDVSPLYVGQKFTPTSNGQYNFDIEIDAYYTFAPVTPIAQQLLASPITMYGIVEVYNADNSLYSTTNTPFTFNYLGTDTYHFMGNTGTYTTPTRHFSLNVQNVNMIVGQYAKIAVNSSSVDTVLLYYVSHPNVIPVSGVGTTNYVSNVNTHVTLSFSDALDLNTIHFSQFVPKDVQQVDYIVSILRLFNLYPVAKRDRPRHFNVFTRDEFYSNQFDTPSFTIKDKKDLNWTNKIDEDVEQTVTPIPNLNNSRILFSYQEDEDWYNTLYKSLYGTTYGQLTLDAGYEFSKDELDYMDGVIFAPTIPVQYGTNDASSNLFACEQTCEILVASKDVLSVSGYKEATAGQTSLPDNSSNEFLHARVGVQIIYLGNIYTIINVINPQSFQVDRIVTGRTAVDATYYATNDLFSYFTSNKKIIPAIYQTQDQNVTRTPLAVKPRILYYNGLKTVDSNYYIQYAPIPGTSNLTATYPSYPYYAQLNQYPFCSHLNDDVNPTIDLLYALPQKTYFTINSDVYLNNVRNQFENFFQNQINELTDPDAKMLKANFRLNSIDISNRDLSDSIYVKGTKYRINQIIDFKADDSISTQVELVRQPFQQYSTASLTLINNITGSTSTSEMNISIAPNSGTTILQYPSLISSESISGSTGTTTSTLRGVPFGMGESIFNLNVSAPSSWGLTVLQNSDVVSTYSGTGNSNLTLGLSDIEQDDEIIINGFNQSVAFVEISMDNSMSGQLTGVTANGNSLTYISGATFPMTSGQTGTYVTAEIGTGVSIVASYTGVSVSGSTMSFDDTHAHGSSQTIPTGSGSITWTGQTITEGSITTLEVSPPVVYIAVSEDSHSHSNFTSLFLNGAPLTYISGQTLPMSAGTSALYKSIYTGTQIISTNMTVSVSGDTWSCIDTAGTNHNTTLTSVGVGKNVNTNIACAAGGTVHLSIIGLVLGSVDVHNSIGTANITSITGIAGMSPTFTTITGLSSYSGTHNTSFTGSISVSRTGTVGAGSSFNCRLYKNGVELTAAGSPIQADSTNIYTFSSASFLSTDDIRITLGS